MSNAITIFRTLLTLPLFALLAFGGNAWLALAFFLGAGLLDVIDGKVARARNEVSPFGAMIDLIGDRLLTVAVVFGLALGGSKGAIVGIVLIVRDLVVASLNEAAPGKLAIRVGVIEKLKIVMAFTGLSLLIVAKGCAQTSASQIAEWPTAPDAGWASGVLGAMIEQAGAVVLALAAALTLITLLDYWRRALRAFKQA
ncbi:MAG: CDP-alcohol phosphatidyltransferase family protein [Vitreimonas sp.]